MSFRTVFIALGVSLGIHAAVGYSLYFPGDPSRASQETAPITISYMKTEAAKQEKVSITPPTIPARKPVSSHKILEKRMQRIPPVKDHPNVAATKATLFADSIAEVAKEALGEKASPAPALPKTSAELLADPKRNKIFNGYFGLVKERIHETLKDNYNGGGESSGNVTLSFVLASDGRLIKVFVNEKESHADSFLKDLAVQCLKEAAPFTAFPRDLDSRQISFSLTVYFDEI